MASLEYWESPFQLAGHHLARAFVAAGWKVAYLSVPVSPLHLLRHSSPAIRARLRDWRRGGRTEENGALWSYVPGTLLAPRNSPILRSRWVLDQWWRLSVPNIRRTAARHGFGSVDLLYIDSSVHGFWLDAIEHRASVLRVADRLDGFRHVSRAQVAAERDIAGRVDVVAHAAASLRPHVESLGARRTAYLPNGVDVARFDGAATIEPADLAAVPRPRAIYVGAMESWFGFDAMNALVAAMPDISFVVIGGSDTTPSRLVHRPNLHVLGRRPWGSLPAYLSHVDVGLIPFDRAGHRELVDGIHPLKLYEYFASGLPVVATRWRELELIHSPATLASSTEEFVHAIRSAVTAPDGSEARRAFARAASWDGRLRQLLEAVGMA
jgi:glycosyltransferase involved in cell wall biosynthesis